VAGKELLFDGFLRIYDEPRGVDEEEEKLKAVPELTDRMALSFLNWHPEEHRTRAPAHYTEASLIQQLEREGVGRPGTYASVVGHIKREGYVEVRAKRVVPTEKGVKLWDFLGRQFPEVFDVGFTSRMEADLDEIAGGAVRALSVVRSYWEVISPAVNRLGEQVRARKEVDRKAMLTGQKCPKCSGDLVQRRGPLGDVFVGCSNYPECKYTYGGRR
jgi:DNA topoisomerase-1